MKKHKNNHVFITASDGITIYCGRCEKRFDELIKENPGDYIFSIHYDQYIFCKKNMLILNSKSPCISDSEMSLKKLIK